MSLDQNLFTLRFTPSKDDPLVTELVDPTERPHYLKQRVPGSVYKIDVYDPILGSLLATATAPSATSKHKTIEIHNPPRVVELKYTGTMSFKWRFNWDDHEFEWRREECFIIRKPDPPVLVAVTKEPAGRLKTSSVQILDYNLNRFDIDDRKGLEVVILTALLTFQDTNEAYHTPQPPSAEPSVPAQPGSGFTGFLGSVRRASDPARQRLSRQASDMDATSPIVAPTAAPPPLPPKPEPKVGVDRVAEVHAVRAAQGEGEANEVLVEEEGMAEDYAEYAETLLRDDAMLFVSVRSATASEVPKVLKVVEHTKRLRHKAGLDEERELYQYVVSDTDKPKGPRRINLDDPATPSHKTYTPPKSLCIHLSKIDMPELQPKADMSARVRPLPPGAMPPFPPPAVEQRPSESKSSSQLKREEREREKERERMRLQELEWERIQKKAEKEVQKKAEKEARKNKNKKDSPPRAEPRPDVNKLTRPSTTGPSSSTLPSRHSYSASSYQSPPSSSYPQSPTARPMSAYYSGSSFSQAQTPPALPSTPRPRPSSFYGSASFSNPSHTNTTPGFHPFLRP